VEQTAADKMHEVAVDRRDDAVGEAKIAEALWAFFSRSTRPARGPPISFEHHSAAPCWHLPG